MDTIQGFGAYPDTPLPYDQGRYDTWLAIHSALRPMAHPPAILLDLVCFPDGQHHFSSLVHFHKRKCIDKNLGGLIKIRVQKHVYM